jgi:hypothetical protein
MPFAFMIARAAGGAEKADEKRSFEKNIAKHFQTNSIAVEGIWRCGDRALRNSK